MFDSFLEEWDGGRASQGSSHAADRAAIITAIRMIAWFGAFLAAGVLAVSALGWLDGPAFGDTTGAGLFAGVGLSLVRHAG